MIAPLSIDTIFDLDELKVLREALIDRLEVTHDDDGITETLAVLKVVKAYIYEAEGIF